MRTSTKAFKLLVGAFTGVALLTCPAISAPIAAPKENPATSVNSKQFVQVRAVRGGYRGASAHRGAVAVRQGAGAVVRRGAVVGGGYYGSYCDPNYQNCGSGGYYAGGVYRGGAVARGGTVARTGAVHRGGARVSRTSGRRR